MCEIESKAVLVMVGPAATDGTDQSQVSILRPETKVGHTKQICDFLSRSLPFF